MQPVASRAASSSAKGRPTEKETLTSRLIDRPIRPLFPDGFTNEVQVVATVLSLDPDIDSDIPALLGASAALVLSGMPFKGPIAAAKVGYRNGEYLLNPTNKDLQTSALNLVVAGTAAAVLMVESEAEMLSEQVMLGAVVFGHEQMQVAIRAINELKAQAGKPAWTWTAATTGEELAAAVAAHADAELAKAYTIIEKQARHTRIGEIKAAAIAALAVGDPPKFDAAKIGDEIGRLEYNLVRRRILAGERRIDGRDMDTVRPIRVETGLLPRTHGSALFTRGETQALVTTTLGTGRDAQIIDALSGERKEPFMLHYNFPPFSVGETGMMGSPKRREIGHGNLGASRRERRDARHGDVPVRAARRFRGPRVEWLELDGFRLRHEPVADGRGCADQGAGRRHRDGSGAGRAEVPGADRHPRRRGSPRRHGFQGSRHGGRRDRLQMDIKIEGITKEIMQVALEKARNARLHILGEMAKVISRPREKMSEWAPTILTIKIDPEKIREVIGKGGAVIRGITEETGTTIDIENDGTVKIASVNGAAGREAQRRIELITSDVEVGAVYEGKVVRLMDFGAVRPDPAGQGRSRAHLADLGRARGARQRQAQRG
jgi:polyribonucleotide nucleotidyltransferase